MQLEPFAAKLAAERIDPKIAQALQDNVTALRQNLYDDDFDPAVADLLRVQALIFLTIPFTALPTALLSRRLEFRSQGIANMASAIVGAVTALVLALLDIGCPAQPKRIASSRSLVHTSVWYPGQHNRSTRRRRRSRARTKLVLRL